MMLMQDWLQVLIKASILFFTTLLLTRLMGKKSIARITPFRFVSYAAIAVIAAMICINAINTTYGLIALAVWTAFSIALDFLAVKSKWVHDILNGKETVLLKHGKIMEENLLQERLTSEELLRELRYKNIFSLADVEFAVMEATGDISVFAKSDRKPVTARDLGIKTPPQAEPQTVIMDGNILNEPLFSLGLNKAWLEQQLGNMEVSADNVFLAQVDSYGDLYIDLFNDSIKKPQQKVKELLYANLEKVQADLMSFSLETQDENAKQMYQMNAERLQQVNDKLKQYLLG